MSSWNRIKPGLVYAIFFLFSVSDCRHALKNISTGACNGGTPVAYPPLELRLHFHISVQ